MVVVAVIGEAFVAVKPDASGFGANAEKGVLGSVTGIAKKAAAILGGAFVAQKGFDFLKDSVAAARESNAVAAQTAAAIKSTGGAANVSAKQIDDLANSIARKTGIDDEQIAKASNLLLTFTNVRNEAGKGNDIFNQSTKILADMGKALGTDASGAAIQLGKALNDPVQGISALTRVGVTFNDKQKETIKNLVATGKTAEAQKIILAELGKEFGGSAAAQATASQKLKVTLGNLQEDIGNKIIPVIDKLAGFLADRLPGALDAAGKAFGAIQQLLRPVIIGVQDFIQTFKDPDITSGGIFGQIEKAASKAREVFDKTLPVLKEIAAFIENNFKPILLGLAIALSPGVAAFALLFAKSETFRNGVKELVGSIGQLVGAISEQIGGLIVFAQENLPKFQEAFSHVANAVKAIFETVMPIIVPIVQGVIDTVVPIIERIVDIIKQVILLVTNLINGDFSAAFGNLKKIVGDIVGGVVELVLGLPGRLLAVLGPLLGAMFKIGKAILEGIGNGLSAAVGFAGDVAKGVVNAIIGLVNKQVIDRINDGIPDSLGAGPFRVSLPKNPVPRIPRLERGALVTARPGGVIANIGEGARDEAVLPLPPGLVAGLEAIARGGTTGEQTLFRDLVLQGATVAAADANASSIIRRLRAEQWERGK